MAISSISKLEPDERWELTAESLADDRQDIVPLLDVAREPVNGAHLCHVYPLPTKRTTDVRCKYRGRLALWTVGQVSL